MDELIKENNILKKTIIELEEKLEKYTNGNNHKTYYNKNKAIIIEKSVNYLKKLKEDNPEKIREYAKRAYEKKKEKIKKEKENQNI
jgi:hypothetical protein